MKEINPTKVQFLITLHNVIEAASFTLVNEKGFSKEFLKELHRCFFDRKQSENIDYVQMYELDK